MDIENRSLSKIVKEFKEKQENLVNAIFDLVEVGLATKLEAICTLIDYKMLPIGDWISDMPQFYREYIEDSYFQRYETVYFLPLDHWNDDSNEPIDDVDAIYDFIKEHKIIGTVCDW